MATVGIKGLTLPLIYTTDPTLVLCHSGAVLITLLIVIKIITQSLLLLFERKALKIHQMDYILDQCEK